MEENNGTNGRVEYGKLLEKVDNIQNTLNDNKIELKEVNKNIIKLESREQNGCEYSHLIEKRVQNIELWKANLSGRMYVFIGIIIIITNLLADKVFNLF